MSPAELRRQARLAAAQEGTSRSEALQVPAPGQEAPRERHLHLVRTEERRRASRRRLVVSMVLAAVAFTSMGLVALHVLIAEAQFRLDNLQQQASAQQASYEKLRLGVAQLESPSRIVSVAEGELGMQQPGSVTYLPAPSASEGGQVPRSGHSTGGGAIAGGPEGDGPASSGASSAPQGDADWPTIKPYLSGSP